MCDECGLPTLTDGDQLLPIGHIARRAFTERNLAKACKYAQRGSYKEDLLSGIRVELGDSELIHSSIGDPVFGGWRDLGAKR
jgi:hypothetical protein